MASQYDRGRRWEWTVRDDLREKGYDVGRTAGSKSPIDLFAVPRKGQGLLFIQCKLNEHISESNRLKYRDYCLRAGADPIIADRVKEGRRFVIRYRRVLFNGELSGDHVSP